MDIKQMFGELDKMLDENKAGVLTCVDPQGVPRMRWMTAGTVRGQDGFLYSVTFPDAGKVPVLREKPKATWLFTAKNYRQVISVTGTIQIVENPNLLSTVIEALGRNLEAFWKLHNDPSELVVIETVIEEIEIYHPGTGERERSTVTA